MNSRMIGGVIYLLIGGAVVPVSTVPLHAQDRAVAAKESKDDSQRSADILLARSVTLNLSNVTLVQAIDAISRTAKVFLQYNFAVLNAYSKRVSVKVANVPLGVVLDQLFDRTGLHVASDDAGGLAVLGSITRMTDSTPTFGVVTGRVVDSVTGQGLKGATVKVAGTRLSVLAADSGRFTLNGVSPGKYVLTVRLFGYRPVEQEFHVVAGERTTVRIPMRAIPNVLTGVVTTAAGTRQRSQIGNDVTVLNADSIMRVAPVSSVTDLLENRVPGLVVMHTSGIPGAPSRLRLRGASSVNASNDPIVIVDGVRQYAAQSDARSASLAKGANRFATAPYSAPSPIDQIDPNTIETLEVFKGPSASSLYGADAANGVIVITTKKGRAGQAHVTANASLGVSYDPGRWPVNYYRFGESTTLDPYSTPFCQWYDASCRVDSIVAFQALNDSRYTLLARGTEQKASVTVSGGPTALRYALTGSGSRNVGGVRLPEMEAKRFVAAYHRPVPTWMHRPDNYDTRGLNGTVDATAGPKVQLSVMASLFNSDQQQGSLQRSVSQLAGRYLNEVIVDTAALILRNITERTTLKSLTSRYGLSLNAQPLSWLPIRASGGLSTVQRTDESLVPQGLNTVAPGNGWQQAGVVDPISGRIIGGDSGSTEGFYSMGRGSTQDVTLDAGTTFRPLAGRVIVSLGVNYHSGAIEDVGATTSRLDPGVSRPIQFRTDSSLSSFTQSVQSSSTYGWYIEPQLNISERFNLTPSLRLDGGSASGSGVESKAGGIKIPGLTGFPKTDFSWRAVNRLGQAPLWGFLSLLRPRGSFGYAGVQPGPTDRLRLLTEYTRPDSIRITTPNPVSGVGLTTLGNTQLRPERSSELEGGADVQLWGDRVLLTYTQFGKTRRDAILAVPVAASVWNGNYLKNVGEIRNTGTEMTVQVVPVTSRTVNWNLNLIFSSNHSRVVRLNDGQAPIQFSDGTRVVPGYPLFGRWAVPITSFADDNGSGFIDPFEVRYGDSLVYVGQQSPKYELNVNNDLTLFGLGIHVAVEYKNGLTQLNAGAPAAVSKFANDPTSTFGTQAAVIGYVGDFFGGGVGRTNIGLAQTVSSLRLSELSFNYSVPTFFARKLRVPLTQVSLMGRNVGLHTNYRGNDPAVNVFSTGSADRTVDTGQLPEPRTWTLRITMGN